MRPLDPRLVRQAPAARRYLLTAVGVGALTTGLVLGQATLLAHVVAHARSGWAVLRVSLVALAAVLVARAAVTYTGETAALRAAAAVKSQLRLRLVRQVLALGPRRLTEERAGELATLTGRGLDALDPYFARYLPQLVLACLVPVAVLARVAGADLVSAVTIAVTIPLVPLFMVLVGSQARARTDRQWRLLVRLGGHFLDVVEGLPTLKVFGRAKAQVEVVRRVTDEHRRATMATLRVAFLSALVLELLATLATALVAVEVGLRLLAGHLPYETALLVLLLTPEAYLPLRAVGTQYHASMEGVTAVGQALDVLDLPVPPPVVGGPPVDVRRHTIAFERVTLRYPDRAHDALHDVSFALAPGEHLAVVGTTGAGKSSVLALLLGFVTPSQGRVLVGGRALETHDLDAWRRQVAWVPQQPYLFAGSVADNIRLADPEADDAAVRRAAGLAGAAEFVEALPDGYATRLADRGRSLSSGQRQRIALARAFLRDAPLLLLDEPTAHLDHATAADVRTAVRRLMAGRTVVVVAHTHGWTEDVDRVLTLADGRLVGTDLAVAS